MRFTMRTLCAAGVALAAGSFPFRADAAVQFIAASTADNNGSSLTIGRPGVDAEGQLLVAQISFEKGSDIAVTAPAGWQPIVRTNRSSDFGQALYYRFTTAAEPVSFAWGFSQTAKSAGAILRYDGIDAIPVVTFSEAHADSSNLNAPSLVAEADSRLVAFFGIKKDTSLTGPAGMAMRASHGSTQDVRILAADEHRTVAGATGERSSVAGDASKWVAQMIDLRGGGAGGGGVSPANPATLIEETDGSAAANGVDTGAVRVSLVDGAGNPVSGVAVHFQIAGGVATLATPNGTTDALGQFSSTLTSTTVGTVGITAQFDSDGNGVAETAVVNGSPAEVAFVAPGSTVDTGNAGTQIEATDNAAIADGVDTGAVRVTLLNGSGAPVAGVTVSLSTTGSAVLAATSGVTNASGQFATTLTNTVIETAQLTAQFDADGNGTAETAVVTGSPASVVFSAAGSTVDTGNAGTQIEATDNAAIADGVDTGAVRVTLLNGSGAPVAGVTVSLSTTGSAVLAATSGVTNASGQFATTLTNTVIETAQLTAQFDADGNGTAETAVVTGSPASVVFSDDEGGGAPVGGAQLEVLDGSALANGTDFGVVRAILLDVDGLPVAGVAVAFATTDAGTFGTATGDTDANGRFSSTVTSIVVGSVGVTARYDSDDDGAPDTDITVGSPATVAFSAPPVDAAILKRIARSLVLLDGSGDRLEYEIIASNRGSEPIFGADVLDALPDGLSQVQWTCEALAGGTCGATSGAGDVDETVDLAVGGSVRYLVTGLIANPTGSIVINAAAISAANDVVPGNNVDTALYQRCELNFQTSPELLELMPHLCVFRDGYEN